MAERRDVLRAKTAIGNAYYELLYQKPKSKITVKDILAECNYSHGTFYAHYRDIEDLNQQVEEEIYLATMQSISKYTSGDFKDLSELIAMCVETFELHKKELCAFRANHNEAAIIDKLRDLFRKALVESRILENCRGEIMISTWATNFLVDACLGWITDERPVEREQFIQLSSKFLYGGLNALWE